MERLSRVRGEVLTPIAEKISSKRQVDLNWQEVVDLAHSYYEHLAAPKHQ
jgi:hypothetical protein